MIITQRLGTKLQAEQKLFHRQIVIEGSNTQLGFILAFTWTLTTKHFSKYAFMTKCMLQAADLIECREQMQFEEISHSFGIVTRRVELIDKNIASK